MCSGETYDENTGEMVHGVVGGELLPLDTLFEKLDKDGFCEVEIRNSFFKIPYPKTIQGANHMTDLQNVMEDLAKSDDPGQPLLTVEFMAGPDIKKEYEAYKLATSKGFFKPSELPTTEQSWVISHMLSPIVKELFVNNMDKGIYNIPMEAPAGFKNMDFKQKFEIIPHIPGE